MNPLLEKLAQSGLTEEQVQRAQERAEDFLKAASSNGSLRKELMEKMGFSPWSTVKSVGQTAGKMFAPVMGQTLAYTAAGAALGGGAFAARRGYEAIESRLGKAKAYKEMVEARPELKDRDPKAVQRAFDSLYRFNPRYAKDPLVAGSFVDSVSSSERLDLGTVNALVSARKGLDGAPFDPSKYVSMKVPGPEEMSIRQQQEGRSAEEHKAKMEQYDQLQRHRGEEHPVKMEDYARKEEKHEWDRPKEKHVDPMTTMYTGGK